jgi:acetyl-CoA synthetase
MHYPYQITSLQQYESEYALSVTDPDTFWSRVANHFTWFKPFDNVLQWEFETPDIKWFSGGKLNITFNCLDRHVATHPDKVAFIFEPNDVNQKSETITYAELLQRVSNTCYMLQNMGVVKGSRVIIYMGMIPQLAITLLACARMGAIHSVVFGGFSARAIADRIADAQADFVVTCDAANRGSKLVPLKDLVDQALIIQPVKNVLVFNRCNTDVQMMQGRDIWWHIAETEIASRNQPLYQPAVMDSEDTLFILYTSGSTGKPKGVVHTCAGYMIWTAYTYVNVFQYKPEQTFFCTADIGWITGHSYLVYGPLLAGATSVLFEGVPNYPDAGRLWDVVHKHQVDILYTAPTAIRSLMAAGLEFVKNKNLVSIKVLGTVGEPINEEAWHWYHQYIGNGNCPIVDTWWQTETGGILISNLAGVTPHKPAHATTPLPGVQPILLDDMGKEILGNNVSGNLCIKFPWPGILRTTYGDHNRCKQNYFATYPGYYFTGDGCLRDVDGHYRITGRVDDVLNVSGHRLGTAEIENAINTHKGVIESAVVGYAHDIKGQGIYAYVIYQGDDENAQRNIAATVNQMIGAIAKPDKIQLVSGLPKTRSGKIMRRILRKIAEGDLAQLGDTTTLLDPSIVDEIKNNRL